MRSMLSLILLVLGCGCVMTTYPTSYSVAARDTSGNTVSIDKGMHDTTLVWMLGLPDQICTGREAKYYSEFFGFGSYPNNYTEEWTWVQKHGLVVVYLEFQEVAMTGLLPLSSYRERYFPSRSLRQRETREASEAHSGAEEWKPGDGDRGS